MCKASKIKECRPVNSKNLAEGDDDGRFQISQICPGKQHIIANAAASCNDTAALGAHAALDDGELLAPEQLARAVQARLKCQDNVRQEGRLEWLERQRRVRQRAARRPRRLKKVHAAEQRLGHRIGRICS